MPLAQELTSQRAGLSRSPARIILRQTMAVAEADVRKLHPRSRRTVHAHGAARSVAADIRAGFQSHARDSDGGISYLDFMAPGILAQSVMFGAIFTVSR